MKKTLLLLLLMLLVLVSLVLGMSISASATDAPNAILKGTDLHMERGATYTFTEATSVAITSGSAVTVDGKTVTAAAAGTSVVTVDGTVYTVGVLPEGYKVLNYLESHNTLSDNLDTCRIQTGYSWNDNTVVRVKAAGAGFCVGVGTKTTEGMYIELSTVFISCADWSGDYFKRTSRQINRESVVPEMIVTNGSQTADGVQICNVSTTGWNGQVCLFGAENSKQTSWGGVVDLFACEISDNNGIARYFVPCVNNGVYGLYDTVGNILYKNILSGKFTGSVEDAADKTIFVDNPQLLSGKYAKLFYKPNESVKITVTKEYFLSDYKVLKKSGGSDVTNDVNMKYDGVNNKVTFTMPNYDVELKLTGYIDYSALKYHDAATIADTENLDSLVNVTTVSNTNYLFLPSNVNFAAIPLVAPSGTTLAGTQGTPITVDGKWDSRYDLTTLFGTMTAGKTYGMTVTYPGAEAITVQVVKSANVPTMYVTSDKTIAAINGSSDKSVSGTGTVTFVDADGKVRYDGGMDSLKGRGNSSWICIADQKPYNIKLTEKAELIDEAGKAKKWCLLAGDMYTTTADWVVDNPMMSQMTGFQLYQDLNGAYNYEYSPIDLYVNGDYRGTYLLVEAIQINKARVNITETKYSTEGTAVTKDTVSVTSNGVAKNLTAKWSSNAVVADGTNSGGFILEMDNEVDSGDCYFITTHGFRYFFKDPDMPTKAQVQAIAQYVQDYEDALFADSGYNSQGKYYADYMDLDSMALEFAISKVFASDGDSFRKSEYFTVDVDADGNFQKIQAAPTWDFDGSACASSTSRTDLWISVESKVEPKLSFLTPYFKHADFVDALDELVNGDSKTTVQSYWESNGQLDQFITTYGTAKGVSRLRFPTSRYDFNANESTLKSAAAFKKDYTAYVNSFYNNIWKDTVLRGATVSYDKANDKLVATANTTAEDSTYQWYTVSATGALKEVAGATTAELANPTAGITYEVAVTAGSGSVLKTGATYDTKDLYTSLADDKAVASIQFSAPIAVYSVSYDLQGHGSSIGGETVASGSKITAPTTPTDDNWIFEGWYKEAACTNAWNFSTDTVTADTTLYAKWTEKVDLTGTATITGTAKYGETLTVSLTDSNNKGTLSYQWKRGDENISGATDSAYTLTEDDIGKTIKVVITSDKHTNSITSTETDIVAKLEGPAEPSCTFSFDDTNAGKLMGATTAMEYSLDGGNSYTGCTTDNMLLTVADITADNDIKVRVKKTTTTNAGSVQTIDITKASAPTGVNKTDCTTADNNDGTLTGVTTAMEYRLSGTDSWTSATAGTVDNLTNGTYQVRVKANGTALASDAVEVTIGAYSKSNITIGTLTEVALGTTIAVLIDRMLHHTHSSSSTISMITRLFTLCFRAAMPWRFL